MSEHILKRLGLQIDSGAFLFAMTHRSYAYENGGISHNERLEFLGDAVLGFVIAEALYVDNPDLSEGELAKRRASVVNTKALAGVARSINLGEHIRLGRGEELTGGRDKDSILADSFEALIGAIYLSSGAEQAKDFIISLVGVLLYDVVSLDAGRDWKTALQELTSMAGLGLPEYIVDSSGPDHAKVFVATIVIVGEDISSGLGSSKKEAEKVAAANAWKYLSYRYPDFASLVFPNA